MTEIHTQLSESLKALRLPVFRKCYQSEADLARQESLSHEQYLFELVKRECEERADKRTLRYLRESRLPLEKSMEIFERKRLPPKVNGLVDLLLEGSFVGRNAYVLAFGNPGSGKTHLLCAIGQALVLEGHRVLFTYCNLLVQDLLIAKRDLKLAKVLKKLSRYQVIIIDDLGYVQQSREEMEVLFTLLADRYERGTVMLTSNLPFSKWEQIFKDPMTTAAAIDRLVHHSIILELNLPSYRLEQSKKEKKTGEENREL